MKTTILIVSFVLMSLIGISQDKASTHAHPYFSAIIVNNLDTSILWYQSLFDLKIRHVPDVPQGFRVAILESPILVLELIENLSWLDPKKVLEGKPPGTQIRGFFKIGFKVENMDMWMNHLKKFNVVVDRIYKDASNKRNFLVTDPDGNLVQFFE